MAVIKIQGPDPAVNPEKIPGRGGGAPMIQSPAPWTRQISHGPKVRHKGVYEVASVREPIIQGGPMSCTGGEILEFPVSNSPGG